MSNTEGGSNTAVGEDALRSNTTGGTNTAVGAEALRNTTGDDNTAVGEDAGFRATTGDNNIYLGANVLGVVGEANTMYLGRVGTQTTTFIAGVRGITTGLADAIQVLIDSSGQLGTVSSSRRYKEDIQDMGRASAGAAGPAPGHLPLHAGVYRRRDADSIRADRGGSRRDLPGRGVAPQGSWTVV